MTTTKLSVLFGILFLSTACNAQTQETNKPRTTKYAGLYKYGRKPEKGPTGTIYIYPETDSTILFYIQLNIGPPSLNMGELYGRVKIFNNQGAYFTNIFAYGSDKGCKCTFDFSGDILKIKGEEDFCGFGHAVYVDGDYKRISKNILFSFRDLEWKEVFFKTTPPEEYYRWMYDNK